MTRLFLGLDGGQTGTAALVGDQTGRVLGTGRAGPANFAGADHDLAKFSQAVRASVESALHQAGISQARFEAACLGLSGACTDKEIAARSLVSAARYHFTHDADIALTGATGGRPGLIVVAGTGSIAFGRAASGSTARAGGWGYAFGDEGGAFDLVRQALRAALRHQEGWGPPTILLPALTEAAGAQDAHDLLHRFYREEYSRARVASFARLVDQTASAGDAVARDIVNGAAQALATLAGAVRGQLFEPSETVTVSYGGGVFGSAVLLERFRLLVELEDGNRVAAPLHGPAAGALLQAYRIAEVGCTLQDVPEQKP